MNKLLNKILLALVLVMGIAILLMAFPFRDYIYSQKAQSSTEAVLETLEKQGKLQVIKMYLEQVHKEEIVRDLFGIDMLAPDSRTLVSFTSVATACVDLAAVTRNDIEVNDGMIRIRLPKPELCDDPYIIPDSFQVYDQNLMAMIVDPQQEITAQQKAVKLARDKALENDILGLAEDQAESVISKLLSAVTDKQVAVIY